RTNLAPASVGGNSPASAYGSDTANFAAFMRLSAPPAPAPDTPSIVRGRQVFQNVGCQTSHVMTHTPGTSRYTGHTDLTFFPFSDLDLHRKGTRLADNISQGNATGSEFRTAPLWGIGQRIFFLHDGRTSDLYQAILAHASNGSEANMVISHFQMLSQSDQQNL